MKITISGVPGSGKTTVGKILAHQLGHPFLSVGDLRGQYAREKDMTIEELNKLGETDPTTDTNADEYQKKFGETHQDFIVEGRLAFHFIPDSFKVFLTANEEISAQRMKSDSRPDETKCSTIEGRIRKTKERMDSDTKRYKRIYGVDCYKDSHYDVLIDTSYGYTAEEIAGLVEAKAIDFHQKMFPPNFYLAHPTESRKQIRKWEKEFEQRTGINLINPFDDCQNINLGMGDFGKEKYRELGKISADLFRKDLETLAEKTTMGGIFILDESYTIGTPAEMIATKLMGKLTYVLMTHPDQNYLHHPTIRLLADEVFSNETELENFLIKNKPRLFRLLEDSRHKTVRERAFAEIYGEIKKNDDYLTP